jgi:hypothetical protein
LPPSIPPSIPPRAVPSTTQHTLDTLFDDANMVTEQQKTQITDFMTGKCSAAPDPLKPVVQILLSEKMVEDDSKLWIEQILFEINYTECTWLKLRCRKPANRAVM